MIREATQKDAAALDAFLAQHAATSMFLRSNLARYGTQERTHRHGTWFYLYETGVGIAGVAARTNAGYLACQAPEVPTLFWQAFAGALKGQRIKGMSGVPAQVGVMAHALGLQDSDFGLNADEPLFTLALSGLARPAEGMTLRKPVPEDVSWLAGWFEGYFNDTQLGGHAPGQEAAGDFVQSRDARIGQVDGQPVAMSNFNARLSDMVQIGGVYVPPVQLGQGYGGAVVAHQLLEARAAGSKQAILFAASDFAARAYQRIGFQPAGSYRLAMLKAPMVLGKKGGAG